MSYNISYDKQPEKFLEKLDKHIASRIIDKLEATLSSNSVPHNAVAIEGEHGIFRIRIGDFRILYRINYQENKLIVVKLDKRSRVYD